MVAYMNQTALMQTLQSGQMTFYSRSRASLWVKGETSGNRQTLIKLVTDCDRDTLIAYVAAEGPACHLGTQSCFQEVLYTKTDVVSEIPEITDPWQNESVLKQLTKVIADRRANPVKGSYTNYLLDKGIDKILKKVGEEATETIIGAKNNAVEMVYETADLLYHLLVLYENQGVPFSRVLDALAERR